MLPETPRISFASRKSERHPWSSSYYNLTDQIPAGFGVVEDDKVYDAPPSSLDLHGAGYAVRDVRPDRIRWSFAFERGWMDRAFQTGYVLRAQFSGDFATGVARFEDFYDESLFSQTASRSIAVLDDVDSHGRAGVR